MEDVPRYLRNHEVVVSAFGSWPSFHDAPVLGFDHSNDQVTLALHAWEMSPRVDAAGYFVLEKHHLVRFSFRGVTEADLTPFTSENILFALVFSPAAEFDATGRFTVELDSVMGGDFSGSFAASSGEVTAVLPCDPHAQPL